VSASTRRIATDVSALYADERASNGTLVFDVVIVGSGYGGAMAAAELAGLADASGQPQSVLVLERGKEYTPGMFPSSLQEVPAHVRVHREKSGSTTGWLDGLFDLRLGGDVCALLGNGLGGGSLINAGVMERPHWNAVERMPDSIKADLDTAYLDAVKTRLGARQGNVDNTIGLRPGTPDGTSKTQVLRALGTGQVFRQAAVTVEMQPGAALAQCTLCGDCMTGCNVGAKKSLDTNLLLQAWQQGARIHTGASVVGLRRGRLARWELTTVFTDESLRRRHQPLTVRARTVIVAAGALGSPELLLRSEAEGLRFSPRLGQQFSCNGDNILAVRDTGLATNPVAHEHVPLDARAVGPTITGVVEMPQGSTGKGFLVQEFGVPAALERVFDEIVTTTSLLHNLAEPDNSVHVGNADGTDPLAVQPQDMAQVLLLGLIGHDEGAGQLRLPLHSPLEEPRAAEGNIRIEWPEARKSHHVEDAYQRTRALVRANLRGGKALPNPLWRMLPEELDFVFRSERGPLLTVHPLGGCPIGADRSTGAVDEFGRVFDGGIVNGPGTAVHPGLLVLDGSILPSSLGANPSLTIAAVAQRAARRLAQDMHWTPAGAPRPVPARPRLRSLADCVPPAPAPTEVEVIERLCGPVKIAGRACVAELTLQYRPCALADLARAMRRDLEVAGPQSMLRVYDLQTWHDQGVRFLDERERRLHALLERPVTGTLSLLQREPSWPCWRKARGFLAYVFNRGLRDLWSNWREVLRSGPQWPRLFALASHAGEVRRYDYDLQVGAAAAGGAADAALAAVVRAGSAIRGRKRFTYGWRGNPWKQVMGLELTSFPGQWPLARPLLKLDGRFMARFGVPLLRIVRQQNQVVALAEMASFMLFLARLFVSVHLWSFRAPDPMPPHTPRLLPGPIKGLAPPVVIEIELEPPRHGKAVAVRLTRYPPAAPSAKPPLVFIHGYSASGTTFTHEDIPEPMARYFSQQGRDVWILDLRTSAGMPSAVLPWNFEDAALADIPIAIERILAVTGAPQVDVFAHCIGAVMLSMALLADPDDAAQMAQINDVDPADGVPPRRYDDQVRALKASIRRIVLSQKGPVPVYSDGNVLRAYLTRVLRSLVLPQNYQFRVPADQSLGAQGLDRLLSSLPYPDNEQWRENPLRPCAKTPWAAFRHRMDALYARDFSLANISDRTLGALEDLFGPLNLDTVSQAVHFARYNRITNGAGRNCFVTVTRMQDRWPAGGTLAIHGEDNGLADIRTLAELSQLMAQAPALRFEQRVIKGFGHQDCLIGVGAREAVLEPVERFLSS
jgi:choline dehydrogenase-like flavoprotein/pimeloyl-ACP methyl ester carboxylesterase